MNTEVLNEVHTNDLPQRVRNTIDNSRSTEAEDMGQLKRAINNFCWIYLPAKKTIRQAEMIACKIFQLMTDDRYTD